MKSEFRPTSRVRNRARRAVRLPSGVLALATMVVALLAAPAGAAVTDDFFVLSPGATITYNSSLDDDGVNCAGNSGGSPIPDCPCSFVAPNPAIGTISLVATGFDGGFRYTHFGSSFGEDRRGIGNFSGALACSRVTVSHFIINEPPVVVGAGIADVTVDEDSGDIVIDLSTAFTDGDLARSFSSPALNDELTFTIAGNTNPALFSAAEITGSTLTLTPAPEASGTSTITVRATDNRTSNPVFEVVAIPAGSNQADDSFVVTVNAVNDPPTVTAPIDTVNAAEDDPDDTFDLATVFTDAEGDTLTFDLVSAGNPALAAVTVVGSILTIDYQDNAFGSTTITVRATDDGSPNESATHDIAIDVASVNDAPFVVAPIAPIAVVEDAAPVSTPLGGVFADVEPGALVYSLDSAGDPGLVTATASAFGGSLDIAFVPDATGSTSVTIRATDSGTPALSVTTTVAISVSAVNDVPVVAAPFGTLDVDEDAAPVDFALGSVFFDPDVATSGDVLTYTITDAGLDTLLVPTIASGTLTITFVPQASGSTTVRVRATDGAGEFVEDDLLINVASVNDVPVARDDTATVDEDPLVFDLEIEVLANDDLFDGPVTVVSAGTTLVIDGVTYENVTQSEPTIVINALGDPVQLPNGEVRIEPDGVILYQPKPDFAGIDFFDYTVRDADGEEATARVTITVNAVDDPPVGVPDRVYDMFENNELEVLAPGLLLNARDPDAGESLTVVLSAAPDPGTDGELVLEDDGSFTFTPVVNRTGPVPFEYFVLDSDGTPNAGGPYTAIISIAEAPPPPAPLVSGDVEGGYDLSDIPLELGVGVEPNVLVIMDDSGSMDWTLLTEEPSGRFELSNVGQVDDPIATTYSYILPRSVIDRNTFSSSESNGLAVPSEEALAADPDMAGNRFGVWRARNAAFNRIYYDPSINYTPWRGLNATAIEYADAVPTAIPLDPFNPTTTIDITSPVSYDSFAVPAISGPDSEESCEVRRGRVRCSAPRGKTVTTTGYYIPRYYTTTATGVPAWNDPHTLVEIDDPLATYPGGPDRNDCSIGDDDPLTCTYTQELQNFANWFMYYRSRDFTTKNSLGRVVAEADTIRIGYAVLNDANDRIGIESMNASFRAGNKRALLNQIYTIDSNGGTPLRQALDGAGRHYECRSGDIFGSSSNSSPGDAACPIAAAPAGQCQQNFTLLFTDGEWNGPSPGNGNTDGPGSGNTSFDGGVYADGESTTLADVAMDYYERDLHTGLTNEVPTTARDRAGAPVGAFGADDGTMFQHMSTFTIGFGVAGRLTDADIPADIGTTVAWGDPGSDVVAKIDDLRHAALNGRGAFLSAANASVLNASLEAVFDEFSTGEGAASAVSFNSQEIQEDTLLFRGFYNTKTNTGDLVAQEVNDDGSLVDPPTWSLAANLDTAALAAGLRRIVTWDDDNETGIPFRTASLTADQTDPLKGNMIPEVVNYLRGDRSNERPNGIGLRERPETEGLLGDIVHATPVFVGKPPFARRDSEPFPTGNDRYSIFQAANESRMGMVYVAANDGILHGVRSSNGTEVFGYIPDKLISGKEYANQLRDLTSAAYSHRFFVDLAPAISDVFIDSPAVAGSDRSWRTVLVGGLRGGGKGFFALDVTDPSAFVDETAVAAHVLWEFTDEDDRYPQVDTDSDGIPDAPAGGGTLVDSLGKPVRDLGYTYAQPTIAMTNVVEGGANKWAAIFGNGFNSTYGYAKLMALFIEDGVDGWNTPGELEVVKIDTGIGAAPSGEPDEGLPNGLGTPRLLDLDGNGTVDRAYAGDLRGGFYRFDLSSSDPDDWSVTRIFQAAYDSGTPLDDSDDVRQPITSQPIAIRNPQEDGLVIIFATGRYFTSEDGSNTEIQSLYGIWDRDEATPQTLSGGRGLLVEQTLTNLVDTTFGNLRTISSNPVVYKPGSAMDSVYGWYIDFDAVRAATDSAGDPNTDDTGQDPPLPQFPGERAIRNLQLRGGFVFVNTVIPRGENTCLATPGGFALAMNPSTGGAGGQVETIAFDLNNDGQFTDADKSGANIVAGIRFEDAVPTDSSFIGSKRYTQLSDKSIDVRETNTNASDGPYTGRLSWSEIER